MTPYCFNNCTAILYFYPLVVELNRLENAYKKRDTIA